MTNLTNLINMIDELRDMIYGLPTNDIRKEAKKIINKSIKNLLNDYCEQSEHFEAVFVNVGNTGSENTLGVYISRSNSIVIRPDLMDFINNYQRDLEIDDIDCGCMLEIAIDTYLHESRHAKQYSDSIDMHNGEYKRGSECEDLEDYVNLYYNHPNEVDARNYAAKYTEDAMEYISEHLFEEVVPQLQRLLGM